MRDQQFQQWDGGKDYNMDHYGQATAPEILLTGIDLPTALFVGLQDPLGNPTDSAWVKNQLKNVVHYQEVNNMGHGFNQGSDMSYFADVLKLVKQYNPISSDS